MAQDPADIDRLTLIVQRLLDADLILPEEAGALLERIAAAGQGPGRGGLDGAEREPLFRMLEALVETKSPDITASRRAQEIVRRILEDDPK